MELEVESGAEQPEPLPLPLSPLQEGQPSQSHSQGHSQGHPQPQPLPQPPSSQSQPQSPSQTQGQAQPQSHSHGQPPKQPDHSQTDGDGAKPADSLSHGHSHGHTKDTQTLIQREDRKAGASVRGFSSSSKVALGPGLSSQWSAGPGGWSGPTLPRTRPPYHMGQQQTHASYAYCQSQPARAVVAVTSLFRSR